MTSRGPRIGHYEAETTFIARGLGISFTTEASGRLYNRPGIVYVPIVDRPPSFTLAWNPSTLTREAQVLVRHVQNWSLGELKDVLAPELHES